VILVVTTSLTRHCGAPDVANINEKNNNSKVSKNGVLRTVDSKLSNTKLTNKNNIINGTANQLNHYQPNLTAQQQLNNLQQELNSNLKFQKTQKKQVNKKSDQETTSLSNLFSKFAEIVKLDDEDQNENLNSTSKNQAILLNLACDFTTKDQKSKWEALLYNNNLYLQIPADILFETSKEAFVNLLEYAEEELKCQNVIICLDKNCVEKSNNLMRMFMYFGFYALSPSHPLTANAKASDNLLFMAYSFE